jgi:hypothetical protein
MFVLLNMPSQLGRYAYFGWRRFRGSAWFFQKLNDIYASSLAFLIKGLVTYIFGLNRVQGRGGEELMKFALDLLFS